MDLADSRMTVLVVAGGGYVGQFLIQALLASGKVRVHATYNNRALPEGLRGLVDSHQLDATDPARVAEVLRAAGPDVVVNCAAASSLGVCEKDPALAERINCPFELVRAFGAQEAPRERLFVHFSTDIVFAGDPGVVYAEEAAAAPVNVYGRVKTQFDAFLADTHRPICAVVRPTNILGPRPPYGPSGGTKFLQWLDERLRLDEVSKLFDDEFRSYVWVTDVVAVVEKMIEDFRLASPTAPPALPRLLHCGGPEALNRVDVAKALATARCHRLTFRAADGAEVQKIVPTHRGDVDLGYASPLSVRIDSSRAEAYLGRSFCRIADRIMAEGRL